MNVAQIVQGVQSDSGAELLVVSVLLLCIVMTIYLLWKNGKESHDGLYRIDQSDNPDNSYDKLNGKWGRNKL